VSYNPNHLLPASCIVPHIKAWVADHNAEHPTPPETDENGDWYEAGIGWSGYMALAEATGIGERSIRRLVNEQKFVRQGNADKLFSAMERNDLWVTEVEPLLR